MEELKQRIINRVNFHKGCQFENIVNSCRDRHKPEEPKVIEQALEQLVRDGKIQCVTLPAERTPRYYPAGYEVPRGRAIKPIVQTIDKGVQPDGKRKEFDEGTERLYAALEYYKQQGQPFFVRDVSRRAGFSTDSCIDRRPALRADIRAAIAQVGRKKREFKIGA